MNEEILWTNSVMVLKVGSSLSPSQQFHFRQHNYGDLSMRNVAMQFNDSHVTKNNPPQKELNFEQP